MTNPSLIERITRSLAYMLRHKPEEFDIELDRFGAADVFEVVQVLNERLGEAIEEDDLLDAIETGDRVRYSITDDRIRALYGHSIEVDPGEPEKPQELLYVGLGSRDAERAERYGLRAGRRAFLHLAKDEDQARESGRRQARRYVVMTVFALDAWEQGINFYDRGSLYLSEPIPTEFLEMGEIHEDGSPPRSRDGGRERGGRERGGRERGGRGGDSRSRGRGRGRDQDRDRDRDRDRSRSEGSDRAEREVRDHEGGRRSDSRNGRGGDRDSRPERSEESSTRSARSRDEDRPSREDRAPRRERAPREDRAPRRERAPREDRAPRQERAPREERAPRQERAPREERAPAREAAASSSTSFGLGLDDGPAAAPVKEVPRPPKAEKPKPAPKPAPEPTPEPKREGPSFGSGV